MGPLLIQQRALSGGRFGNAARQKSWLVGALGLSEGESKLLAGISSLTRARPEGSYVIGTPDNLSEWNIIILNTEDKDAMTKWAMLSTAAQAPVPVLYSRTAPASIT